MQLLVGRKGRVYCRSLDRGHSGAARGSATALYSTTIGGWHSSERPMQISHETANGFPTACSGSFLPFNFRYSSTAAWGRVTTCPRLLFFRQSSTARISMLQGDKAMCSMALQRAARLVTLAIVLVVGCVFGWPSHEARAQRVQQGSQLDIDYYSLPPRRGDKVRVRRPPLMPPHPRISVLILTFRLGALKTSTVDQALGTTAAHRQRLHICTNRFGDVGRRHQRLQRTVH